MKIGPNIIPYILVRISGATRVQPATCVFREYAGTECIWPTWDSVSFENL